MKIILIILSLSLSLSLFAENEEFVNLSIKTTPRRVLIKLDGKEIGVSPINKKIAKKKFKLEIEKEFYKKIEKEIDTSVKTDFYFNLKPIDHTIEVISRPENIEVEICDKNGKTIKTKKTPFKLEITLNDIKNSIRFKKDGYETIERGIFFDQSKILINIKKADKYILKIDNKRGFNVKLESSEKGKNSIKLKNSKINLNLNKANYHLTAKKKGYNKFSKKFLLDKDVSFELVTKKSKTLKIKNSIKFITEYGYSTLNSQNINIGFMFDYLKYINRKNFEISILSLGVSGDFINSSLNFKFSLLPMKFYLYNNSIFFQVGIGSIGDEIDILFKDDKKYIRGLLSAKVGGDLELFYPSINIKSYIKIAMESLDAELFSKSETGLFLGVGFTIEYNTL